MTYLFHFSGGAAVDITSRAVISKKTWGNVAQGQEATASVAAAGDNLVTIAGLLIFFTTLTSGNGQRGGEQDRESDDVLHFDGRWWVVEVGKLL